MTLVKFDPWRSLEKAEREMQHFFEDFRLGFPVATSFDLNGYMPRIDTSEDEKNLYITAELPGMKQDDVKVTVLNGAMTIQGKKERREETTEKNYHRIERSFGEFARQFELPEGYKKEKIHAKLTDGILQITVPKSESKAVKTAEQLVPIEIS